MAQCQSAPEPGRYDKVGPLPFLAIRHLLSKNGGKANLAHARAFQHTLPLYQSGSRHDHHVITPPVATGLEQKRYIENGESLAPHTGTSNKPLFFGGNHRVQNRLQPSKRPGICKD